MEVANTLAYYDTAVKSLMRSTPGIDVIKPYWYLKLRPKKLECFSFSNTFGQA